MNEDGQYPAKCPSLSERMPEYVKKYDNALDHTLAYASSVCGPDHCEGRILKTIRFAKECGFKKIGLAFCVAVKDKAEQINRLFIENGLHVESVVCKVGHCDRGGVLGVTPSDNAMCNPIAQAELMNEANTELNVVLGLCVGHDTLFIRHSKAPVTIIAAKDHVYNNAPLEFLKDMEAKC